MDERADPDEMPERLSALGRLFARDRSGERDWLGDQDPRDPAAIFAAAEQAMSRPPRRPWLRAPRRRRLLPFGGAAVAVLVAVVLAILQLRGASGALAAPNQAAAAAERARTFIFETNSRLQQNGVTGAESKTIGHVDLEGTGAFKVLVTSPAGVGFERVVLPKAVYLRPVGVRGSGAWFGAELKPPATITAHSASGGGLADPLGLLAALADSHASYVAEQSVDGQRTRYYRLTLNVGELLGGSVHVSPQVAAIPVRISVWQNSKQQLVRAVRVFDIGGPGAQKLTVQSDFRGYGQPATIVAPPGVHTTSKQRLNPSADDPLGASVLHALAAGTGHVATPAFGASRTPRSRPAAPGIGPTP